MPKTSAGLLMYRLLDGELQVLLSHPGGPFFGKKDLGVWSIQKGEAESEEPLLAVAQREFFEETGIQSTGPFAALGSVQQKGGKVVHAWAFEGDCDPANLQSNTFSLEWPPRSGRQMTFPEMDQFAFFGLPTARLKIHPAQIAFLDALESTLSR